MLILQNPASLSCNLSNISSPKQELGDHIRGISTTYRKGSQHQGYIPCACHPLRTQVTPSLFALPHIDAVVVNWLFVVLDLASIAAYLTLVSCNSLSRDPSSSQSSQKCSVSDNELRQIESRIPSQRKLHRSLRGHLSSDCRELLSWGRVVLCFCQ